MDPSYDVIVVSARWASSPTALLLARRGDRVLLVDRMGFPQAATDFVSALAGTLPVPPTFHRSTP